MIRSDRHNHSGVRELGKVRSRRLLPLGFGLVVLALTAVVPAASTASAVVSANLITNPGAEAAAGSSDGSTVAIPNWTTASGFTAIQYGASGGFPGTVVSTAIGGGSNFFGGGPNSASSSAFQVIDVSASAAGIDTGNGTANLSGYLGGFDTQDDNMVVVAAFLSASNTQLGTLTIGPVTAADRANVTTLLLRSTSGAVPTGTRTIKVTMTATRLSGTANDGYADNLSLTLDLPSATPTTTTTAPPAPVEVAPTFTG